MKFRQNYEPSTKVTLECKDLSRTKQSFKDECDINRIVGKLNKTGILPSLIKENPQYGDFSNLPDFQSALNIVQRTADQFNALSSTLRERFANDPARFLAFCQDPNNAKEMVDLGLAIQRPAEEAPKPKKSSSKEEPKPKES